MLGTLALEDFPPTTVTFDTSEMERMEYLRESLGVALRIASSANFSRHVTSKREAPLFSMASTM